MSVHTGNHSSNICWMNKFLYTCTIVHCVIIYWELIPTVRCMYKLPRKVLTICFSTKTPRECFFLISLPTSCPSHTFCSLKSPCSSPLMHLHWLLPSPRIPSCHTFTWLNSSYYSGLTLTVTSLTISCEGTSSHSISQHPILLSLWHISLPDIFLFVYLFVWLCFFSLEC